MAYTIDKLISVTKDGIDKANYADIVQAYLDSMRMIWGYDLDLDPRTADGREIYAKANITNTILNAINNLYANWNPSTATGKFLDILCSLTNVQRNKATKSKAKVTITNNSSKDKSYDNNITSSSYNPFALIDDSGNEWDCTISNFTIPSQASITLTFECSTAGKIKTTSLKLIELDANISISINAISVGTEIESDADLRNRRANFSTQSISIKEGLQGTLLSVDGVKDALVISNNTGSGKTADDNTQIASRSVYIVLRYDNVVVPVDTIIGKKISDYLTIGILTTQVSGSQGHSYTLTTNEGLENHFYWKVAVAVKPTIQVTLHTLDNFAGETTAKLVGQAIVDYLNNSSLNENILKSNLSNIALKADPLYMSRATFYCTPNDIGGDFKENNDRLNKCSYYEYENATFTPLTTQTDGTYVFTIKSN